LNLSHVYLQTKQYADALRATTIIIEEFDNQNAKAFYRRFKARFLQSYNHHNYDQYYEQIAVALEDLKNACRYLPENKQLNKEYNKLKQLIKTQKTREIKCFYNCFEKDKKEAKKYRINNEKKYEENSMKSEQKKSDPNYANMTTVELRHILSSLDTKIDDLEFQLQYQIPSKRRENAREIVNCSSQCDAIHNESDVSIDVNVHSNANEKREEEKKSIQCEDIDEDIEHETLAELHYLRDKKQTILSLLKQQCLVNNSNHHDNDPDHHIRQRTLYKKEIETGANSKLNSLLDKNMTDHDQVLAEAKVHGIDLSDPR
jgi:hypothetical protein